MRERELGRSDQKIKMGVKRKVEEGNNGRRESARDRKGQELVRGGKEETASEEVLVRVWVPVVGGE